MKKLIFVALSIVLNACAYNSTMGVNDRFQVATTASMFAPSVTTVVDTKTDSASTYAGPSIVGQVVNAAGGVAGGYLLGQGIGKSGTRVTQNGGGASATGGSAFSGANANSKSSAHSSSSSQAISQSVNQVEGGSEHGHGHHSDD